MTGDRVSAPLRRLGVSSTAGNGLRRPSQRKVDKPQSVQRQRLGPVIGRPDDETMASAGRAMAVFGGLV